MEDVWLDAVSQFLKGEEWRVSVKTFVDSMCHTFAGDPRGEFSHTHYTCFLDFGKMVDRCIAQLLASLGGTDEAFFKACDERLSRRDLGPRDGALKDLLRQLLTFDDFDAFRGMMAQHALELATGNDSTAYALQGVDQSQFASNGGATRGQGGGGGGGGGGEWSDRGGQHDEYSRSHDTRATPQNEVVYRDHNLPQEYQHHQGTAYDADLEMAMALSKTEEEERERGQQGRGVEPYQQGNGGTSTPQYPYAQQPQQQQQQQRQQQQQQQQSYHAQQPSAQQDSAAALQREVQQAEWTAQLTIAMSLIENQR